MQLTEKEELRHLRAKVKYYEAPYRTYTCPKSKGRSGRRRRGKYASWSSRKAQAWLNEFMDGLSCDTCGISDKRVFVWHHNDPSKKLGAISTIKNQGTKNDLIAELAKCRLLCRNCHAIEHYGSKKP